MLGFISAIQHRASMTKSYKQIQKEIDVLQRQADKLRSAEIEGVVSRIKVAINHYGLTAHQLFGAKALSPKTRSAAGMVPKYSDGNGRTWSGRGERPTWLRDAIASGKNLEDFATQGNPSGRAVTPKRKARHQYRDRSGNTWSGMGPKPRWIKTALEAGMKLEELQA